MTRERFGKLYEDHRREVWELAYARCKNPDTAMDVTQEAFLRLWREYEDGVVILNPRAWLRRVARNLAEDHRNSAFRRNGTHPPQIMNAVQSGEQSVEHALARREDTERFRQAYAALSAEERELLELKLERTEAEIVAEKGWTRRKVKRKVNRARAKARAALRPLLQEYYPSRGHCSRRKPVH